VKVESYARFFRKNLCSKPIVFGCFLPKSEIFLYLIFNASNISRYYYIPASPSGKKWRVSIDTSNQPGSDIFESGEEPPLIDDRYFVKKLSAVVMIA